MAARWRGENAWGFGSGEKALKEIIWLDIWWLCRILALDFTFIFCLC